MMRCYSRGPAGQPGRVPGGASEWMNLRRTRPSGRGTLLNSAARQWIAERWAGPEPRSGNC
ncbi:MAG: hypothetical protein MZV64_02610 [Ignavibacteriales bacterium]|nr:hypothetical protein [Ignavibacteriales bacterium]